MNKPMNKSMKEFMNRWTNKWTNKRTNKWTKMPLVSASLLLLSGAAIPAAAHTPYLLPNAFEPINGGLVTLDASFAGHFFTPEVVFDNSEFEVRLPSGKVEKPQTVIPLQSRVVVEHDMSEDGTYRFSTGRRLGRVFKAYEVDGKQINLESPDMPVPDGAKLIDFYQSHTIAEVYVTRGAPSEAALAPRGDGLEYVARTHPNDLFVGDEMEMQALFYGKPIEGLSIDVFSGAHHASDDEPTFTLTSGADGSFSFTPEDAGAYLLRSRHRAQAPAGSAAPELSHTYTLVIEAAE